MNLTGKNFILAQLKKAHRYIDIIGFHYYLYPINKYFMYCYYASMARLGKKYRKLVWKTEGSFENKKYSKHGIEEAYQPYYMFQQIILLAKLGIRKFCWYSWDNTHCGFLGKGDNLTKLGEFYKKLFSVLNGYQINNIKKINIKIFCCELINSFGKKKVILWTKDDTVSFKLTGKLLLYTKYFYIGSEDVCLLNSKMISISKKKLVLCN